MKNVIAIILVLAFSVAQADPAPKKQYCWTLAKGQRAPITGDLCTPLYTATLGVKYEACLKAKKKIVADERERCEIMRTADRKIFDATLTAERKKNDATLDAVKPKGNAFWNSNKTWILAAGGTTLGLILGLLIGIGVKKAL